MRYFEKQALTPKTMVEAGLQRLGTYSPALTKDLEKIKTYGMATGGKASKVMMQNIKPGTPEHDLIRVGVKSLQTGLPKNPHPAVKKYIQGNLKPAEELLQTAVPRQMGYQSQADSVFKGLKKTQSQKDLDKLRGNSFLSDLKNAFGI